MQIFEQKLTNFSIEICWNVHTEKLQWIKCNITTSQRVEGFPPPHGCRDHFTAVTLEVLTSWKRTRHSWRLWVLDLAVDTFFSIPTEKLWQGIVLNHVLNLYSRSRTNALHGNFSNTECWRKQDNTESPNQMPYFENTDTEDRKISCIYVKNIYFLNSFFHF